MVSDLNKHKGHGSLTLIILIVQSNADLTDAAIVVC